MEPTRVSVRIRPSPKDRLDPFKAHISPSRQTVGRLSSPRLSQGSAGSRDSGTASNRDSGRGSSKDSSRGHNRDSITMIPPRPLEKRPVPVISHSVHNISAPAVRQFRTALYDDPILVTVASAIVRKHATVYTILVYDAVARSPYKIERRYSQFFNLRASIEKKFNEAKLKRCPGCESLHRFVEIYEFPKRQLMFSADRKLVKQRALALRGFIRELTHRAVAPNIIRCPLCQSIAEDVKEFLSDDFSQFDLMTERATGTYGRIGSNSPSSKPEQFSFANWSGKDEEVFRFDLDIGSFAEYMASTHHRDEELLKEVDVTFKGWKSIVDRETGIAVL